LSSVTIFKSHHGMSWGCSITTTVLGEAGSDSGVIVLVVGAAEVPYIFLSCASSSHATQLDRICVWHGSRAGRRSAVSSTLSAASVGWPDVVIVSSHATRRRH